MSPRLASLVSAFVNYLNTFKAPATRVSYERSLRGVLAQVDAALGRPAELEDLTRKRLQAAIALAPRGASLVWMVAIRSFYRYLLVEEELELRNPSLGLVRPYAPAREPARLLTEEEALALMRAPLDAGDGIEQVRDAAVLLVLYGFGLRTVEVSRLDLARVRLDAPMAGYCEISVLGKGNRWDDLPAGRRVRDGLARYLERRQELVRDPGEPALFLQGAEGHKTAGGRLSRHAIYKTVRRYVPEDVRLYPHLLRHALASHLVAAGADAVQVRDLMRHRSLATTNTYVQTKALIPAVNRHPLERAPPDDPDDDDDEPA